MTQESFFQRLKEQEDAGLPLVVYRKPGESAVKALLQKDSSLNFSKDFAEAGFVFSAFDDRQEVPFIPLDTSIQLELNDFDLESEGQDISKEIPREAFQESGIPKEKEAHLELVKAGIAALKTSSLEKVVLSRKEEVGLHGQTPLEIFKRLLGAYPNAFVYCWQHPHTGTWLGATPETLLKTEGLNFHTMALAGTQNFNGEMEVDWGEKEKQEQQFVTDSILDGLGQLEMVESIKVSETYTSRAGDLLHLKTDISGRMQSAQGLFEVVRCIHPTPAVCGLPKAEAKDFILENEAYEREFYTGFLGELNFEERKSRSGNRRNIENLAYATVKKNTSLYVNLRCMKLEDGNAIIYVGGGITTDSVPEDEYWETVNKAGTMKRVLFLS